MFKATTKVKQRNEQVAPLKADNDARIAYAKTHATAVPIIAKLKHNLKGNTFALSDNELKSALEM
jgi:UDP-N-acetylglucosamine pyrophosphorylase